MPDITRALAIDGWMNEAELIWLANAAATHHRIVEVGAWMGRSTRALADNAIGTIYAVDHWQGSEEHQPMLADKPANWLYERFCENLADHILDGRVKPIRLSSLEAAAGATRSGETFDVIFLDASHDYDFIRADIIAWRPLVRPGGIICGHDRGYEPVTRAVAELLGEPGGDTDIWVVQL